MYLASMANPLAYFAIQCFGLSKYTNVLSGTACPAFMMVIGYDLLQAMAFTHTELHAMP